MTISFKFITTTLNLKNVLYSHICMQFLKLLGPKTKLFNLIIKGVKYYQCVKYKISI